MKKVFLSVIFLAMALLPMRAGKVVTDRLYSRVLKDSVYVNVYLPSGFAAEGEVYPVVYLLHGLSDDYTAWVIRGNMQRVADELIESGEARKMVIIMPNAGGEDIHNTPNGYFNMPGWAYEDFFFQELIPAVEQKYNCGGSKGRRAVMGLSMGGGGSTVYAQRHPWMFSSCYAMSPWLDNKHREVGSGAAHDWLYHVGQSVSEHSAMDYVDNAEPKTIEDLKTVKWFIDCGDDDYLFELSVSLYLKMRTKGIKCELRVRNGIHNWEYWHESLRMALPFASRNFSY